MNRKELKELGLEDEVIDQVMASHGKDIEKLKASADTLDDQLKAAEAQLEEATKTIDGFKAMNIEEIQAAADEWKATADRIKEDAEKQIQTVKFDHALEKALSDAKAKNPKAVRALLNVEGIKLNEEGVLEGIDTQLETIKTENDYLFEIDEEEEEPQIVTGGQTTKIIGDSMIEAARKAAGLEKP